MSSRAPVTQSLTPSRFCTEFAALLRLAIPVVSRTGWMAMSIVDTITVGRLSPAAIGAVGISSAIFCMPALFGIGLLLGLDTLVAQAFGRGDFDDCHRALAEGVYLAIVYTPLAMLVVGLAPHLFPLIGITERCAHLPGNIFSCSISVRSHCSSTSPSGVICRVSAKSGR